MACSNKHLYNCVVQINVFINYARVFTYMIVNVVWILDMRVAYCSHMMWHWLLGLWCVRAGMTYSEMCILVISNSIIIFFVFSFQTKHCVWVVCSSEGVLRICVCGHWLMMGNHSYFVHPAERYDDNALWNSNYATDNVECGTVGYSLTWKCLN